MAILKKWQNAAIFLHRRENYVAASSLLTSTLRMYVLCALLTLRATLLMTMAQAGAVAMQVVSFGCRVRFRVCASAACAIFVGLGLISSWERDSHACVPDITATSAVSKQRVESGDARTPRLPASRQATVTLRSSLSRALTRSHRNYELSLAIAATGNSQATLPTRCGATCALHTSAHVIVVLPGTPPPCLA